ncbi:MAG: preprotein translocase subunit YajC [Bacteroidales bacterium]|nr:preprotein translocase subunit YajC [Bacteroidales bacterium]
MMLLDISNGWKTAIMVVALIAVFYFFMIKPQRDAEKKEQAFRDGLKAGDRLITAGGIHVKFVSRDGQMATVEAAPGVRMKVQLVTLRSVPVVAQKGRGAAKEAQMESLKNQEPSKSAPKEKQHHREPLN